MRVSLSGSLELCRIDPTIPTILKGTIVYQFSETAERFGGCAGGEERTLLGLLALVSRRMANLRQRVDFDVGEATSGHTDDTTSDTPMATLLDTLSATPSSSADDEASEAAQRASLALLEEAASNLYQV